jgi:hypothetical protein
MEFPIWGIRSIADQYDILILEDSAELWKQL